MGAPMAGAMKTRWNWMSTSDGVAPAASSAAVWPQPLSVGPESSDDLHSASDYTYTYQWYLKEGASGTNTAIAGGTGGTVVFPTGKNAADNKYWVTCEVTAVRKDNGMQKTITSLSQLKDGTYCNVVITRAPFTSEVSLSGWTYGETRNVPAVSANPGSGTVKYEYNTSADAQSGWTTAA